MFAYCSQKILSAVKPLGGNMNIAETPLELTLHRFVSVYDTLRHKKAPRSDQLQCYDRDNAANIQQCPFIVNVRKTPDKRAWLHRKA